MKPEPEFHNFDASHLTVLALAFLVPATLAGISRHARSERFENGASWALAALLSVNFVAYYLHRLATGQPVSLPMQLCDWALAVTIGALVTRSPRWFELAYFWGLGGTLQALITPNLRCGFPAFSFVTFFITHAGIVAAVLFLVLALKMRPHAASLWRVLVWSEVYLGAALATNALTGGNYGFLAHKPAGRSLLDFLPDQPGWYVLAINAVAIVIFVLLYLPFFLADAVRVFRRRAMPFPS